MKMISLLTAAALLVAGSAYAATATAPAPAAAPPATTSAPAPAAGTAAPAKAAPAKQDHHCRDEANEKKLAGAARAAFVKKCRADSMKK